MSLAFGRAPFAPPDHRGTYADSIPDHVRYWEPWPRRMRALLSGRTVLDSEGGVMLHETGALPVLYFPRSDFDELVAERIEGPPRTTAGDELLPGLATLPFDVPERWFEEDDPVYAHVRDPYHRVDVRSSSRPVEVRLGGELVASSSRPKLLFETGNPIRYYLPFDDVRIDLLELSETISECPYKGDGQHWHLRAGGEEVRDAGWSLPHPLPEGIAAAEHITFYPTKVEVRVDGAVVPQ